MSEKGKIVDVAFPTYRRGFVPDENMIRISRNEGEVESLYISELPACLLEECRQFLIREDRADSRIFRRLRREFFVREEDDV